MAKIKFGALMVDARGKIGGTVFSRNRGGAYMKNKVTPLNPQSSFQSAVRSAFAFISSGWLELTPAQRESFNSQVTNYQTTDIFGDLKSPSGKALFQRLNTNLANFGLGQLFVCPLPKGVPAPISVSADGSVGDEELNVSFVLPDNINVVDVLVEATAPLSVGITNAKNRFRKFHVSLNNDGSEINLYTEYVARFGVPAVGSQIQLRAKAINDIGLTSPYVTTSFIVSA
jgi:hypothetical protein